MAFSVTEFKSGLKQGGARPSLFKVELQYPSGVTSPSTNSEFLIKGTTIPASNIGTHEVFFHGKPIKVAGDRTYDTWETTIINDEDFGIRKSLEQWMNLISNHKLNTRSDKFGIKEGDNADYKKTLTVKQFSKTGSVLCSYKFTNAFPTSLSTIALDWGTQDIEEFTCTWTYDSWEKVSGTSSGASGTVTDSNYSSDY